MLKYPKLYIRFKNIEDLVNYIKIVDKLDYNFNLCKDNFVVDGCSMMGILAADIRHTWGVLIYDENINDFKNRFSDYIVDDKISA